MARKKASSAPFRLPRQSGEIIDRTRQIRFTFDGRTYRAHPGDTIASALAANGVRLLGRSFKYHRPRGLMAYGHSLNGMVQVGAEPSVSAWLEPVVEGMDVRPVNSWPSLRRDWLSATRFFDRFLPVGFYYKTFIRPRWAWPYYEKLLRRAAGLGRVDFDAPPAAGYLKRHLHADVVVIGAGPAGLSAALAAAGGGARVLLLDDQDEPGGHWRWERGRERERVELAEAVRRSPGIQYRSGTFVQGWFEDHWLFAVRERQLYKIRGRATIIATGVEDQPLIFDQNDLPGVMMGSAVQRLLHLYGVAAGKKPLVVTANEDGWQLAADLQAAGLRPAAVVDQRPQAEAAGARHLPDVPVFWQSTVAAARGRSTVERAVVRSIPGERRGSDRREERVIACDLIAVATGWAPRAGLLYLAGGRAAYDDTYHEFRPTDLPPGVFLAGRVTGSHSAALQIDEGDYAGRQALAYLDLGEAPPDNEGALLAQLRAGEPGRTSGRFYAAGRPGGKRFVDLDEDVTDRDIRQALAEGYDGIELLKRYTTLSMGPSQGKWSSINALRLVSVVRREPVPALGRTTARPPLQPIKLAHLAGQILEPERVTPLHAWHVAHGAHLMAAGLWTRPEHYGDPAAEVRAVREQVGLIDVSTLGKIKLTGPGAGRLLDRLYVNSMARLPIGRARYGVMCSSEGVIFDDGVVARLGENDWYLTTTSSGAEAVFEWIQWWAQSGWGEGVLVTDVTEVLAAVNLSGPRAREILSRLVGDPEQLADRTFPYMRVRHLAVAGIPCRLLRIGFTGELSFEIHPPAGEAQTLWERLLAAGAEDGIRPFGVEAQRVLRLEKGHLIVGQDTDALSDPFSAGLGWAVKLDKSDFIGQRSLLRLADSEISRRLVGFKMERPGLLPEEGLQIVEAVPRSSAHPLGLKIIGWISSARFSPTLGEVIGLCWLPAALADRPGTPFTIRRGKGLVTGRVHHGPFVDPEGSRLQG